MGLGGISIWQLLIILAIVVMIFGTKRLGTLGSDLGSAIRGFRSSMKDSDSVEEDETKLEQTGDTTQTIDSTATRDEKTGG